MSDKPILSKEFLAERDARIFKMRQAGVSVSEISRRFNVSTRIVGSAISRQLEKLNRETALAYPEVLRMELERLDGLQAAIWPLTQHRKETQDDGTEVQFQPDMKAVQQVLSIMDRRSKLLGMEQNNVNVNMDITQVGQTPIRATLAGQEGMQKSISAFDPESEARALLTLMGASGVLPADTVSRMLGEGTIVDAEVIEDERDGTESSRDGQLEIGDGQSSRDD